jgi:exosortase A
MTDQAAHLAATAAPPRIGGSHPWMRAGLTFAALAGLLAWTMQDALAAMALTWWNDVTYTHGLLVPLISLHLVWGSRRALAATLPRAEPLALVPLVGATLAWVLGHVADAQVVQQAAFVGALVSLAVAILGRGFGRVAWFPLLFLGFMVPAGDFLIAPLQDFTAAFSVALLRLVGIPTYVEGILIYIPSGAFEVAEACAGLRFLIANVVVAALFAYLVYDRAWKRATFLAVGIGLPILANGLRAFGIIVLAHATDHKVAAGADHIVYGWGFFSAVMLVLLWVGNRFADRPVGMPDLAIPVPRRAERPQGRRGMLAACAAALAILAGPAYAWSVMGPPDGATRRPAAPAAGAAWVPAPLPGPAWEPAFEGPDAVVRAAWTQGTERAELALAWYDWQRQGAEAVNEGNRFADETSWTRVSTGRAEIAGRPARLEVLRGAQAGRLVASWYWVAGRLTPDPLEAKLLQTWATLTGGSRSAAVVALSAPFDERAEEALSTLQRLAADLPLEAWLAAAGTED